MKNNFARLHTEHRWRCSYLAIHVRLLRACPMATLKCPLYSTFWMENCIKTILKLLGACKKCTCYQNPPKAPAAGDDSFSTRYDCFSLATYNDSSCGESQVVSHFVKSIIFSGSRWVGIGEKLKSTHWM